MSASIAIIAGEPSGDFLGGQLAHAIRVMQPDSVLSGVGGQHMAKAGIESLFGYEDLAVMGVAEILPNLPTILKRIRQTIDFIKDTKPDVVVTIDSPDFCFRVVKALRKEMVHPPKFVHYVAPTVWAWRAGRAEKISKFLDGLICLFDFEPPYFEKHGLTSIAAGHPLVEGGALQADGAAFRDAYGIAPMEPTIGVLFGSRKGELKRTGRVLRDAAFSFANRIGGTVHIIAPTLPHVKDDVFALLRDAPGPIHITTDPDEKWNAFAAMDTAIAVSGTVGLELAAMCVPHVIGYKMSPTTAAIIRRMIKVKYAHLANIMEDNEIVPEFLQGDCRADLIAAKAFELYLDPQRQKEEFMGIRYRIGADQDKTPSQKAAAFVLSFL